MNFLVRIPVADLTRSSSKSPCDIHLKHVLLKELNFRQNPAYKVHQILNEGKSRSEICEALKLKPDTLYRCIYSGRLIEPDKKKEGVVKSPQCIG